MYSLLNSVTEKGLSGPDEQHRYRRIINPKIKRLVFLIEPSSFQSVQSFTLIMEI
jgi:hypothetical protein